MTVLVSVVRQIIADGGTIRAVACASTGDTSASLAAYAAAPIAGSRPLQTAMQSLRISLVGFLIPFVFAFNPSLLIVESFEGGAFVWVVARLIAAVWMIATAFAGYDMRGRIGIVFRIARFVAGIVVLLPDPMLEIGGFVACIVLCGIYRFRRSPAKIG